MNIAEALSLRQTSHNAFEGIHLPEAMGNSLPIAYGGYAMGTAVGAAYRTVDSSKFRLYSLQGSYLGPASTDRVLTCTVRDVRSTKSFATRLVEVGQTQANGTSRVCLTAIADFHTPESANLLEYSVPQPAAYSPLTQCATTAEVVQRYVKQGQLSQQAADFFRTKFAVQAKYYEQRLCPEGVNAQRLIGVLKTLPTTQDERALTDRTSADWARCKGTLREPVDHAISLAFFMDGGLAFIPLTHSGMFLEDAGACSSLDFSLRFFESDLAMDDWHLREARTIRGGNARTFTEGRLFKDGKLIASMTQQSIMRPKPEKQRANI